MIRLLTHLLEKDSTEAMTDKDDPSLVMVC